MSRSGGADMDAAVQPLEKADAAQELRGGGESAAANVNEHHQGASGAELRQPGAAVVGPRRTRGEVEDTGGRLGGEASDLGDRFSPAASRSSSGSRRASAADAGGPAPPAPRLQKSGGSQQVHEPPATGRGGDGQPHPYFVHRRPSATATAIRDHQAVLVQHRGGHQHEVLTATTLPDLIARIGCGRFQVITLIALLGLPLSDCSEMLVMTTLGQALQQAWGLSDIQAASLASLSYVGLGIGTFFSGTIADVHGRRCAVLTGYTGMACIGCVSSMATGYCTMAAMRLVNGMFCGIGVPASLTVVAEVVPGPWRSVYFLVYGLCYIFGEIFACVGLLIYMPDLGDPARWRAISNWSSIPAFVFLAISVACLQETPHWLLVVGRVADAKIVLEDMARKNGRPEVVQNFGPPGEGTTNAEPVPPEAQQSLAHIVATLFMDRSTAGKLMSFTLLTTVCNMVCNGMNYFWPIMLRAETTMAHSESPAYELLMVRLTQVPISIVGFVLISIPWMGHKLLMVTCAIFGIVSLQLMRLHYHVVISGIVMMGVSNLFWNSANTWLTESFPTQIRASAVGAAASMGRIAPIVAPLLIAQYGTQVFLNIVCCSFFISLLAAIPLQETKGAELTDYTDEVAGSTDAALETALRRVSSSILPSAAEHVRGHRRGNRTASTNPQTTSSESDAESSHPSGPQDVLEMNLTLHLFPEGTVGARNELLLLAAGLGLMPGCALSSYRTAGGFFADLLNDKALFSHQVACTSLAGLISLFLRWLLEPWLNHRFGIERTMFVRLVLCSFALAGFSLAVAGAETRSAVLFLGALIGAAAALVLSSGLELAAMVDGSAALWVHAGFAVGCAVPVFLSHLLGFGPGADAAVRVCFFGVPAVVCKVGGATYWWYHRQLVGLAHFLELFPAGNTPVQDSPVEILSRAYRSMQLTLGSSSGVGVPITGLVGLLCPENPLATGILACVFASAASGMYLMALIPSFGTPIEAQAMYSYKVAGEALGRVGAVIAWESGRAPTGVAPDARLVHRASSGSSLALELADRAWTHLARLGIATAACVAAYLLLALPVALPMDDVLARMRMPIYNAFWLLFFASTLSGSVASCFDVLLPIAMTGTSRIVVVRWQMLVVYLGAASGAACAAICYATSLAYPPAAKLIAEWPPTPLLPLGPSTPFAYSPSTPSTLSTPPSRQARHTSAVRRRPAALAAHPLLSRGLVRLEALAVEAGIRE